MRKKLKETELDFEIDKLTNSIENSVSGEIFETEISRIFLNKKNQIKNEDWIFDWHDEFTDLKKEIYKLATISNPAIIQGLISISVKQQFVFMHLIESASFNRGRTKLYFGVPGNLIAFACKTSFERGFKGVVSFQSKTQLVNYYQNNIGAKIFGSGNQMFVDTNEAKNLVFKYFKNFNHDKL